MPLCSGCYYIIRICNKKEEYKPTKNVDDDDFDIDKKDKEGKKDNNSNNTIVTNQTST